MKARQSEIFQIGDIIREKLVPNAVLWFTGEALDYENDYDDEDEEEEEDDGEEHDGGDDDDDADTDYVPPAAGEKPQECKQS